MIFALIARDRPGALSVRLAHREAHLAYVAKTGCVTLAGPFVDEAGGMCGSLLLLDLPDLAAARDWAAADPYALADLFDTVTITEWRKVVG